jgi:hypothetical protein
MQHEEVALQAAHHRETAAGIQLHTINGCS